MFIAYFIHMSCISLIIVLWNSACFIFEHTPLNVQAELNIFQKYFSLSVSVM